MANDASDKGHFVLTYTGTSSTDSSSIARTLLDKDISFSKAAAGGNGYFYDFSAEENKQMGLLLLWAAKNGGTISYKLKAGTIDTTANVKYTGAVAATAAITFVDVDSGKVLSTSEVKAPHVAVYFDGNKSFTGGAFSQDEKGVETPYDVSNTLNGYYGQLYNVKSVDGSGTFTAEKGSDGKYTGSGTINVVSDSSDDITFELTKTPTTVASAGAMVHYIDTGDTTDPSSTKTYKPTDGTDLTDHDQKIEGNVGDDITFTPNWDPTKEGYSVAQSDKVEGQLTDTEKPFYVYLTHNTTTTQPTDDDTKTQKHITVTVTVKDPKTGDETVANTQEVDFERSYTTDDVTKQVTYGNWQVKKDFADYKVATIDGYTSSVKDDTVTRATGTDTGASLMMR
ncbi:mucin-binding protein [Lacticaseibacillus nasuensis]|uniref:mucin-binding protein n=1 Tax=Lacticaseibacillus nasuensis TaxID=944671 RepID=UPI0015855585|nr:hypothetical protein [Lacticaseibacillus nasuensis]